MSLPFALSAAGLATVLPAGASAQANRHIQHIEHGLRLPIAVEGAPDQGMDLAERMRA